MSDTAAFAIAQPSIFTGVAWIGDPYLTKRKCQSTVNEKGFRYTREDQISRILETRATNTQERRCRMINGIRLSFTNFHIVCTVVLLFGLLDLAWAKEPENIVDEMRIKSMTEKAEPLIEELTGRKYKDSVKIKLVKRNAVRDVLIEELLPQLKKLLKGAAPDTISRQAETAAHSMSQVFLGKYSYLKKELYLIPDNVKAQVEMLEINDEDFEDFVFLVVAHEMVHALDDQHFDLQESLRTRDSAEKMQAFNALAEGHAVYAAKGISDRLKLSEMAQKLSVKSAAGITDENNRMQQQIFHNVYVMGSELISDEQQMPFGDGYLIDPEYPV